MLSDERLKRIRDAGSDFLRVATLDEIAEIVVELLALRSARTWQAGPPGEPGMYWGTFDNSTPSIIKRLDDRETMLVLYAGELWRVIASSAVIMHTPLVAPAMPGKEPAADSLPVDEAWLRSVGFTSGESPSYLHPPGGSQDFDVVQCGGRGLNFRIHELRQPKTRQHVRDLCRVLGVALHERKDGGG